MTPVRQQVGDGDPQPARGQQVKKGPPDPEGVSCRLRGARRPPLRASPSPGPGGEDKGLRAFSGTMTEMEESLMGAKRMLSSLLGPRHLPRAQAAGAQGPGRGGRDGPEQPLQPRTEAALKAPRAVWTTQRGGQPRALVPQTQRSFAPAPSGPGRLQNAACPGHSAVTRNESFVLSEKASSPRLVSKHQLFWSCVPPLPGPRPPPCSLGPASVT